MSICSIYLPNDSDKYVQQNKWNNDCSKHTNKRITDQRKLILTRQRSQKKGIDKEIAWHHWSNMEVGPSTGGTCRSLGVLWLDPSPSCVATVLFIKPTSCFSTRPVLLETSLALRKASSMLVNKVLMTALCILCLVSPCTRWPTLILIAPATACRTASLTL